MHQGDEIPQVNQQQSLSDALIEMSTKGLGMTAVIDKDGKLMGVYTDGDLRRTLADNIGLDTPINDVMTTEPITVKPSVLAAELVVTMKNNRISSIIVTSENNDVVGALNMQDLLRAGVL